MSNATYKQDLHDIAIAVAQNSKNYTDTQIVASEERMKWYVGEYQTTTHDDNATSYQKTVPANATRCKIKRIYGNSVKYAPTTASDTTTAYQKNVPSYSPSIDRASANINTLGGMSYKCNNLFSLDNTSITIPAGSEQWYFISNETLKSMGLINGNTYTIKGNNAPSGLVYQKLPNYNGFDTNAVSFTMDDNIVLRIGNNTVTQDVTFNLQIMLNSGSTALPYEPYYSSIRDTLVTSVKSVGFNIWDEEWELGDINEDGALITSTSQIRSKNYIKVLPNTTYYGCCLNGAVFYIHYYTISQVGIINGYSQIINGGSFTTPSNCYYIKINVFSDYGTTYNNDICINISNVSLNGTYKPYFTASLLIPAQVQALDGYGWGVNSTCYNYIDFNAKLFVKKVGRIDLGSRDWGYNSTYQVFYITNVDFDTNGGNFICDDYKYNVNDMSAINNMEFTNQGGGLWNVLWFKNTAYTDTTAFKTAMSGVYLYYELATPVETDISAYLATNEIEIEPNGTLSFESTYNAYVPSDVSYNGVIKHALATAVKLEGANLGISTTYTNVSTDYQLVVSNEYDFVEGEQYTISFKAICSNITDARFYVANTDLPYQYLNVQNGEASYSFTFTATAGMTAIFIMSQYFDNGEIMTSSKDIMLNKGSSALSYRPHKATVTRALPYQASDGWSVGSVKNVRDFTINKRGTNIGNQDLGLLDYVNVNNGVMQTSNLNSIIKKVANNQVANILCHLYTPSTADSVWSKINDYTICVNSGGDVQVYDSSRNGSISIFKSAMNGVPLFYELDDEHKTESDITAIDNIFEVEEGDILTFVNEEGLPVPSDLTYRIEVAR